MSLRLSDGATNEAELDVRQEGLPSRVYVYGWGTVYLVTAAWGMGGLLVYAGIPVFDWLQIIPFIHLHKITPVQPGPSQGTIVAAAVTYAGGVIGLGTFFLNRYQKDVHLARQLAKDREIAEKQRKLDHEHETQREKRERELAELQRLEAQFSQLAADFASGETLNRINAAIGLAELAQTPDPTKRSDGAPAKTRENYPYFLRAGNRLAAALHQWGEQPARDEVRKALEQMAKFAKAEGTDERLLHDLANSVADANRTAFSLFVEDLSEGMAEGDPSLLKRLAQLCRFFDSPEDNTRCLEGLLKSPEAKDALARWTVLGGSRDYDTAPGGSGALWKPAHDRQGYLDWFARAAKALLDARDALCQCLMALSLPPALGEEHPSLIDLQWAAQSFALVEARDLRLSKCFLQGAYLKGACLQGASLRGAQLQRARLWDAKLQWANLFEAQLQSVNLCRALLQSANLRDAQLEGADLRHSSLWEARLPGANFDNAELSGAGLGGAKCGELGTDKPAHFSPGGWLNADFHKCKLGGEGWINIEEEDTILRDWLARRYPPGDK
jgi:uncharacterized protein YjbI with pentapeptide repeats